MCLAVPGIIESIDSSNPELRMAKVSFGGAVKDICIEWLPEANVGDYVMAHVGTALNIVDKEDAELAIQTANEWAQMLEIEDENHLLEKE